MFGLGNKDEGQNPLKAPPQAPTTPPVDKVIQMRQQGLSNNQIIQTLQNQGIDSNLIFDALNQADIKGGVEQAPQTQQGPNSGDVQNPMELGSPGLGGPSTEIIPPPPIGGPAPMGAPTGFPGAPPVNKLPPISMGGIGGSQIDTSSLERIEEIAEAIIDEKWNEMVKSINKIVDWKDRAEARMVKMDQQLIDIKQDFDNLTKGVLGKIGEYDQNLTNIGTEIKAMEKVFQKVLPSLTENVHALDNISKEFAKKK